MYWFKKKREPVRDYVGPDLPRLSVFFVVQRHEEAGLYHVRVVLRGERSGEIHFRCPRRAIDRFPVGERVRFTLDGSTSPGP